MSKRSHGPEALFVLVAIGGHSVGTALLAKQTKQAIYESIGIAAIAIVFVVVYVLIDFVQKKIGGE